MQTKKKLKIKKSVIFKSIAGVVIFFSFLVLLMFIKLDVLPLKYFFLLLLILIGIDGIVYFFLSKKNYKSRMLGTVLALFFILFFGIAFYYQNATLNFLKQISFLEIQTENYYLVALKNENMSLESISEQNIGLVDDRKGIKKAIQQLKEESKIKKVTYDNASLLIKALEQKEVKAILMEKGEYDIYTELSPQFQQTTQIIHTFKVDVPRNMVQKKVSITKEPFNIYVTGIDTFGNLSAVSRSDVNMVVTVNPITNKILLTSIPRDYYVQIAGSTGLKDKLTHAGLKGVDCSIATIEDLLDTEISYYLRINFSSLVKIIDAIGGIEVDNPFEFSADYEENNEHIYYLYPKGINQLDGKKALAYVRERYSLREGDVARARHQQQVIEAFINKVMNSTILTKYPKLLGSIEGDFDTNLELSSITSFIEMQLDKMPNWNIEKNVLSGSDDYQCTASFPELYSAVMIPNEESLANSIQKINELMQK